MKKALFCLMILAVVAAVGCSKSGVSVNVTDEGRDVYQDPEGSKDGVTLRADDGEAAPGRAPFINLSAYDWDYAQWLVEFGEAIAGLRLPASTETYVEIRFFPGADSPAPMIGVECVASASECAGLEAQIEELADLPPLPAGFPHAELVAKLSRLP